MDKCVNILRESLINFLIEFIYPSICHNIKLNALSLAISNGCFHFHRKQIVLFVDTLICNHLCICRAVGCIHYSTVESLINSFGRNAIWWKCWKSYKNCSKMECWFTFSGPLEQVFNIIKEEKWNHVKKNKKKEGK